MEINLESPYKGYSASNHKMRYLQLANLQSAYNEAVIATSKTELTCRQIQEKMHVQAIYAKPSFFCSRTECTLSAKQRNRNHNFDDNYLEDGYYSQYAKYNFMWDCLDDNCTFGDNYAWGRIFHYHCDYYESRANCHPFISFKSSINHHYGQYGNKDIPNSFEYRENHPYMSHNEKQILSPYTHKLGVAEIGKKSF